MSRLLDKLRRQRRGDGPAAGRDGRSPARAAGGHEPATAVGRAVVLDALSGGGRAAPWYRRPLPAVLAVVALAALLLYIATVRGRPRADHSTSQPRIPPAPASDVASRGGTRGSGATRPEGPEVRPSTGSGRTVERSDARGPVRPSTTKEVTSRRGPSKPDEARPTMAADARATGEATAPPVIAAPPGGDASREDARFRRALHYQQAGDVENAIIEYRALLQANDVNAPAHNNLGLLFQGKGLSDDAAREFRRAIAIDPGYSRARNNLGVVLLRTGNAEAAAGEFRRVLSADPNNQDAMINLALAQRAGGHPDEARETLIRAIEINGRSVAAHYNLALLYEDSGEIARALDHYEAYLKYAGGSDATPIAAVRAHCEALRQRLIPR